MTKHTAFADDVEPGRRQAARVRNLSGVAAQVDRTAGCYTRAMSQTPTRYVMGHDDRERRRLSLQASILNPLSDQLLRRAGLSPGLHVLDIGCGIGELSMVAARLVGRRGRVTGVDIDEQALALAAARAREQGLDHIDFVHSDIGAYRTDASYDAVIGRHILLHTPDPRVVVGMAHSLLNRGGVAVFQEFDFSVVHHPFPEALLYERMLEIFRAFFAKAAHGNIGTRLFQLLIDAGFPSPECRAEYPMDGGADSPFYEWLAESFRSILPRAEALGLVRSDEAADIDSLAARLREQAISQGSCVPGPAMVGCFARKR
jgi:2-polyprenyl-3-methyl-5-hydroxy-6-metoxy-1,4-benzoquinol methylase